MRYYCTGNIEDYIPMNHPSKLKENFVVTELND